ncbi:odorant receptor 13a-like [Odontomachus brunneus]|uniref:odorant receptor 13a-like n=1 Tax=Odontomachus brunneus TaxID=486640 RepID=UPI0013F1B15E|nr:odorant receptor 13a-like [Odontomachus brunneus]
MPDQVVLFRTLAELQDVHVLVMSTVSPLLKIGLQFLGVWPDMPFAIIIRLIFMSIIMIMQYFQYLYIFAHCKQGEVQSLVDSLPLAFDYSLRLIKLMTLWKNERLVREILTHMDTDWRECVRVERDLYIMTTKASISHFCTNVMMSFYMSVGIIYLVGDFAIDIMHSIESGNDTSRPFPVKLLYSSKAEQSPIYELLVVIMFAYVLLNAYTVVIVDALISTLVLHVSGQIDIIHQEFKIISDKIAYYQSCECTIGMLVEKHNKVIAFSKNMYNLFSFMALMQVFWNTLVICILGLLVISSLQDNTGMGLMKTAVACGGVMIESFIFCFAGEYLSLKSKSLADAAYESLWYNMSSNESKKILLIIMRAQKLLTITAGGMANLSLELFAKILKTSMSYMSVLHAMY